MTQIVTPAGFAPDPFALTAVPLEDYTGGPALLLPVEADPAEVVPHFDALRLIVLPFERYADGRAFSRAAELRALGYRGHLRARGPVLVDQFRAALRRGFDDIEIPEDLAARAPEAQWLAVPQTAGYQARLFG